MADKTNESTAVETVLSQLVLQGCIVTIDALLTQKHVAKTIVDAGGDYVMVVKENQPQLRADIELVFVQPPLGDQQQTAHTVDIGHGRIEQRTVTTSEALTGADSWPGLAQVFRLERQVTRKKTGEERTEVVYGIPSLGSAQPPPLHLLALVRGPVAYREQIPLGAGCDLR